MAPSDVAGKAVLIGAVPAANAENPLAQSRGLPSGGKCSMESGSRSARRSLAKFFKDLTLPFYLGLTTGQAPRFRMAAREQFWLQG